MSNPSLSRRRDSSGAAEAKPEQQELNRKVLSED
jgi:hypothetical protein